MGSSSKLIIAVKSSFQDLEEGKHDLIRGSWGNALRGRAQIKFFLGRPTSEIGGISKSLQPTSHNSYSPKNDEVIVDCGDDEQSRVWKTRAICKWVVDKMVTHVLMVDADCQIFPPAVWSCGFEVADYAGHFDAEPGSITPREMIGPGGGTVLVHDSYSWADGAAYFLSKRAAVIIADKVPIQASYIMGAYEDFWVGQILGPSIQSGRLLSSSIKKVGEKV
jgi:hypothetical protein